MIREILEQQGYEWYFDFCYESTRIAVLKKNKEVVFKYKFADLGPLETKKYLEEMGKIYELASRQYVKENVFKLEWLNDERVQSWIKEKLDPNWHYKWCELTNEELLFRLLELSIDQFEDEYTKIFAWIYANNIDIKEDL